jgi:putative CocE/NonD family hydrolase
MSDEVVVERDVMVAMRDGIRLACDIYRPARDGQAVAGALPVILERTPYGKGAVSRSEISRRRLQTPSRREEVAAFFTQHGYVVIYQDCRGRYGSEGVFRKYLDEAADGYDTCAWMVQQPWCNGRIGTMGLSYAAHTQAALASLNPPGLAAMFIDSGGFSNAYQSGIRQGGAFELKQATWAYNQALKSPSVMADPQRRAALEAVDLQAWFADMPWRPGHSPVTAAPEYEDYLFEQWTHGAFDDYWAQPGIYAEGAYEQFADVPQVHMSSWYDPYARTATENYTGMVTRKQGPVRLILGPWTHGDRSLSHAGEVDFGPEATLDDNLAPDFLTFRLRWFDRWLRGVENGVENEPAVRVFVMGGGSGQRNADGRLDHGGHWRQADTWPLPESVFIPYYCHADGLLSPDKPVPEAEPLTYRYDPKHPVPTIGGPISSGQPMMVGGAFEQRESPNFFGSRPPYRPLAERPDVLVFQTAPLDHDVEVTGPIVAHLWIASDCPDTDFTAKLVDVYPPDVKGADGFALNLTNGILRVRYRDSWERPEMMQPGEVYAIRVELFPCSNRFAAGHRIRLDISSSNFPHFDLNFNTGEPEGLSTHARIAANSVYVDASRPSHVVLPMMPSRRNNHD